MISCVVILVLRYFILGRFFHFRYPAKREVQDNLGHEMPRFVLVENKLKFIEIYSFRVVALMVDSSKAQRVLLYERKL